MDSSLEVKLVKCNICGVTIPIYVSNINMFGQIVCEDCNESSELNDAVCSSNGMCKNNNGSTCILPS